MYSNRNGRALEYRLTRSFMEKYPNARLLAGTVADQQRDQKHFYDLEPDMQEYFTKNCGVFVQYYETEEIVAIERMSDDRGKAAKDVTDIKLHSYLGEVYNISLKHNHYALKHPRPGSLIQRLGICDKEVKRQYKKSLEEIEAFFFDRVKELNVNVNESGEVEFSEVKALDEKIIHELYFSVCSLVTGFLNKYSNCAGEFFDFLFGSVDYHKVIVTRGKIEIYDFCHTKNKPSSMKASVSNGSYIKVLFNNNRRVKMRIHTASKRFSYGKSISLKFDSQLDDNFVKCDVLIC